jgi:exosome complex component RRP4
MESEDKENDTNEEKEDERYIIVAPGSLLATSEKMGEGVFTLNGKTYSKYLGIVKKTDYKTSVVPFNQNYRAKREDKVIGQIKDFKHPFWIVDIFASSNGYLFVKEVNARTTRQDQLMNMFKPGSWIFADVCEITDRVKLSMRGRDSKILKGGRIITISPSKIPRVIGKKGSMMKILQDKTGCHIKTGQNGLIWIEGENTDLAVKAIQKIEREAHIKGLTDRIVEMLDSEIISKEVKENATD